MHFDFQLIIYRAKRAYKRISERCKRLEKYETTIMN